MNTNKILDCKCSLDDEETTIREYLKSLLNELWKEGEGFSGKRPFGNSGWENELYEGLVKGGLVKGEINEDGYVDEFDVAEANKLIFKAIKAL